MPERRSGIDLVARDGRWAVVFEGRVLSTHTDRAEAVLAARTKARGALRSRIVFGQTSPLPRLLNDRRRHKRGVPE